MSPRQQADPARYGNAWAAIVQLVRDGHSWSGHERNRLLLNDGAGGFGDVSSVVGLDHPGDGRGLAVVDWDRDGDLDLWYRDRTAPRLRLLLNRHAPPRDTTDFVALKLEGTTCNRDAVGAVVEVVVPGTPHRLVSSVRAGHHFLSQSSCWLHFGLGEARKIDEVRVLWPGGSREVFSGVHAGARWLLKQGTGTALRSSRPPCAIPELAVPDRPAASPAPENRVVLPVGLPLPPVDYRDASGRAQRIGEARSPRLLLLWSATCAHCRRELAAMAADADRWRAGGLSVVALSVDGENGSLPDAHRLMTTLAWPFDWGILDAPSLDRLDTFQRALFDRTVPLAVPLALLCDPDGTVSALYRGRVTLRHVLADAAAAVGADDTRRHALAPPLAGRWFTKPVDGAYAREFMARQFEDRLPEDSLFYLAAAMMQANGTHQARLARELAGKHHQFARRYKAARNPERAAEHFERSLAIRPDAAACHDYGTMLASYGHLQEAEALLERALALDPSQQPTREALALVRKLIAEGQ